MRRHSISGLALLCALWGHAAAAVEMTPLPALPVQAAASNGGAPVQGALTADRPLAAQGAFGGPMVVTNLEATQSTLDNSPPSNWLPEFCGSPLGAWTGGVSAYFLSPHWTGGNTAAISGDILGAVFVQQNFAAPLSASPALWFGYTTASGYGVQTGFFDYSQSWSTSIVSPGNTVTVDPYANAAALPGETFVAGSSLSVAYWDLELTKRVQAWNWTWTGTAGLRYLHLNQRYQAEAFASSFAHHTFDGWGPTISLAGRRPIGSGGWGFYGSGRGALTFGNQNYFTDLFSGFGDEVHLENKSLGVVPTLQVEFGVDYRRPAFGGRSSWLLETGMVGQAYFDAGVPSAIAPIQSLGAFGASTSSLDATLGLFGFRSSVGVNY